MENFSTLPHFFQDPSLKVGSAIVFFPVTSVPSTTLFLFHCIGNISTLCLGSLEPYLQGMFSEPF